MVLQLADFDHDLQEAVETYYKVELEKCLMNIKVSVIVVATEIDEVAELVIGNHLLAGERVEIVVALVVVVDIGENSVELEYMIVVLTLASVKQIETEILTIQDGPQESLHLEDWTQFLVIGLNSSSTKSAEVQTIVELSEQVDLAFF